MIEEKHLAKIEIDDFEDEDTDLNDLESSLENQLDTSLAELDFLNKERDKIGSPDCLGETIKGVVWEQFVNQIGVTAGEDFIRENNGLNLDLSDDAHIQTAENFAKGNIAKHNTTSRDQLEQNYDRYSNTSHKEFRKDFVNKGMNKTLKRAGDLNRDGVETVTDIYTGRQITTKTRLDNGKQNPQAAQREHVKSSAELYDNASLQMANTNEQLADVINNPENLQGYTTASRNNRKSDKTATEMDKIDKNKHWEKANEKAEEFIKNKEKEGEERLKQEGKASQKAEAMRIGKDALKAVIMQMFASLIKEIISKLIQWFRYAKRKLSTLIDSIKDAVKNFIGNIKQHLMDAGDTLFTTILTAIFGPIVSLLKKAWMILKQGWRSLKQAVDYIRNPENKNKPIGILIAEVGKIIIAGLSAVGAIALGETITASLSSIPFFAIEIPLLGSLASLIGMFMGAVVAGIIGAIAINKIDKYVSKKLQRDKTDKIIDKGNEILAIQGKLKIVTEEKTQRRKFNTLDHIKDRHDKAVEYARDAADKLFNNNENDELLDELEKLLEKGK